MKRNRLLLSFLLLISGAVYAAPTLTRSVPANNAVNINVSANMVLMFNESVELGTVPCTLNGMILSGRIAGSSVIFTCPAMDYLTNYTLIIPEGAIKSKANGSSFSGTMIQFTTVERPKPAMRLYDAIIAKDGSGDYQTVQAAIDAAPTNRTEPWLIFIKNGVYDGLVRIPADKPFIHLIGEDVEKTIIQFKICCSTPGDGEAGKYSNQNFGMSDCSVVVVSSKDFYTENISYINTWGYETLSGPQGLAMKTIADRATFKNCRMLSFQDTWMTVGISSARHYVKDCFIEGAVDFIYGSGDCFFETCTLNLNRTNGPVIVAPNHGSDVKWGYIFMNCILDAPKATIAYLGRPWHNEPKTSFVHTKLTKNVTIDPKGWIEKMGGLPAIFADYNTRNYLGYPVDTTKRIKDYWREEDGVRQDGVAQRYLTPEQVASYTVPNVLRGSDSWRPEDIVRETSKPSVTYANETLSWNVVPYAICYAVYKDGSVCGFTKETNYSAPSKSGKYTVRSVNQYGGLSEVSNIIETSASNLDSKQSDAIKFQQYGDQLTIKGIIFDATIAVYSTSGTLLATKNTNSDTQIQLPQIKNLIVTVVMQGQTHVYRSK